MSIFIKGLNIIIKGMKMPKLEKTYKVRLYKAVDGRIIVTACGVKENVFQPVGEAIEIPTPHGDLVDRDKLLGKVDDISREYYEVLGVTEDDIENAPTVIEAEE